MISTPNGQQIPVKIVGSSTFGRESIISDERTYNMFISDGWLLNFAGYEEAINLLDSPNAEGRALFHSTRGNFMIQVINQNVYKVNPNLGFSLLFQLSSFTGEVFIDENLSSQICLVDGINAYIYNYTTGNIGLVNFSPANTFSPNYVTYQNTYFIFGNADTTTSGSQWYVYQSGFNPTTLANPLQLVLVQTLTLQTKPDFAKAAIRIPSHGNNLLVLGSTVGEIWTNVGGIQVYQRNSSINIDYGVASVATIAASDELVAWLGINEKSSPAIMYMAGGKAERLSTDGIDNLLKSVNFPNQSTAMFYRQDGHVFYIITFFNPADNFSIMHDFTTQKFFDINDWDFTYHPARQISYFNNDIYFASLKQGSLMRMSNDLNTMSTNEDNLYEVPFIRKCDTFRLPGSDRFIVNRFSFTIQNGVEQDVFFDYVCQGLILGEQSNLQMFTEDDEPILSEGGNCQVYRPRIDVTISKNGGITYSNVIPYYMHGTAHYKNQPRFDRLGSANQFTIQMRFHGFGAVSINDGVLEIYQ